MALAAGFEVYGMCAAADESASVKRARLLVVLQSRAIVYVDTATACSALRELLRNNSYVYLKTNQACFGDQLWVHTTLAVEARARLAIPPNLRRTPLRLFATLEAGHTQPSAQSQ